MTTTAKNRTDCYTINGIRLALSKPALALVELRGPGGRWLKPKPPDGALWELLTVNEAGDRVTLTGANCGRAAVRQDKDGTLHLTWRGVRDTESGAGPFDVSVEIRPGGQKGITAWRIRVETPAQGWTLWHVEFPRLAGFLPSSVLRRDRFFFPDCWGSEFPGGSIPPINHRYPRGIKTTMQYFGYTRNGKSFYVGIHDPRLSTKKFTFTPPTEGRRCGYAAVTTWPEGMGTPGNGLVTDYDTVVAVLDGDWYDASRLYAEWARPQAWAAEPPAAVRGPRADREVHAWQCMQVPGKPMQRWAEQVEALARRLGVRLGVHFYNWHETAFDTNYPDYFPARRGFRQLVSRLRKAGIVTMPYINGRLWDINAPSWRRRKAERYATKFSAQRLRPKTLYPYLEEYGNGQKLSPMCVAPAFWRRTVVHVCRRIVNELGCDGVYLDQVAAEMSQLCFDASHGHPPGGGGWWPDGCRRMMHDLRRAVGPDVYLTSEANWEGCIADYDALLSYHRYGEEMVPMFPAVYSGLARLFGCAFSPQQMTGTGEAFTRRMAMLFVWGGQLGWGDLTPLLERRHKAVGDYFVALCRTRAAYADVFAEGRMLRPPRVSVRPAGRTRPLPTSGAGSGCPQNCALWRGPEGQFVVFLVNPARKAARMVVRITEETCPGRRTLTEQMPGLSVRAIDLI